MHVMYVMYVKYVMYVVYEVYVLMHAFMALDLVGNTPAQLLETSNRNTDLQIW